MDRQYGMADFFVMEASEYLERLDALVSGSKPPNGEELQRLTRALRGAALMANQQPIAGAAGAFEHLARAVREGRHDWDEATRQLTIRTVDDLKVFVRRVREWTEADTARARELAGTLERAGGRPPAPRRVSAAVAADAGTRAFVAREGAALASSLARVAEAVKRNPAVTEPVQTLLQQMQPLRGLATLTEYPPLPDLLDAIDRAAGFVARSPQSLADPAALLEAGARALTHATREITTSGKADADAAEARRFAAALRTALGLGTPDVGIEALYDGDADHAVVEETRSSQGPRLGQVELTALGEHLKQVGVSVAAKGTVAQRELRVLALVDPLRTLEQGVANEFLPAMRRFARAARDAIAHEIVAADNEPLGHAIQEAGVAVAAGDPNRLDTIAGRLASLTRRAEPAPAPTPAAPVQAAPSPPAEPAPAPPPPPAAARPAAPSPAPRAAAPAADEEEYEDETPDLSGSLMRYERLLETLGPGEPSLDELIAGTTPMAAPVAAPVAEAPVSAPAPPAPSAPEPAAPEPAAAAAAAPATEPEPEPVVEIGTLCYSGRDALARALELRVQVGELVAAGAPSDTVQELLDEVFDLVRLGIER